MYSSVLYATANENLQQQVELTHERSLWRWLTGQPARVDIYVHCGNQWVNKLTRRLATSRELLHIYDTIRRSQELSFGETASWRDWEAA